MAASKTEGVLVLTVRRHWQGTQENSDRRRHSRFDENVVPARLSMLRMEGAGIGVEGCDLLNLSYGGMCFRTSFPIQKQEEYRFLVDMGDPFRDLVLVKAHICWVRPGEAQDVLAGAEFIESSKGWFGPEE